MKTPLAAFVTTVFIIHFNLDYIVKGKLWIFTCSAARSASSLHTVKWQMKWFTDYCCLGLASQAPFRNVQTVLCWKVQNKPGIRGDKNCPEIVCSWSQWKPKVYGIGFFCFFLPFGFAFGALMCFLHCAAARCLNLLHVGCSWFGAACVWAVGSSEPSSLVLP